MAYKTSMPPSHRETPLSPTACIEPNTAGGSLILQTPVIPVMRVVQVGDWVEWLSPALPKQQGEVLAVYPDRTFEVFHPLTESLCRLPIGWVIRVLKDPMNSDREH
jgi:hypothetical protein